LRESSSKDLKNGGHDAIEKLALLYFVMAPEASFIFFNLLQCFSLDTLKITIIKLLLPIKLEEKPAVFYLAIAA